MSQNDYVIANQTTPLFRADLNLALQALASTSSGSTAPATTYANMLWYDTSANTLYMRSEADDAWIALGTLDQGTNTFAPAGLTNLSQAQAEDNTSTVFGQVSGQRLAQAAAANLDQSFSESLGGSNSNGYTVFPNGLIIQWGRTYAPDGASVVNTLPIAFTSAHIGGVCSINRTSPVTGNFSSYYDNTSLTQLRVVNDPATASGAVYIFWICWGR